MVMRGPDVLDVIDALAARNIDDGYEPRDIDRLDMAAIATRFGLALPPAYDREPGDDRRP